MDPTALGWLALRFATAGVYLYAFYRNSRDAAARQWTLEHTAMMLPQWPERGRTRIAAVLAIFGMASMVLGGLSILLGLEPRLGGAILFLFTAGGIYQHHRETAVAMETAGRLEAAVPQPSRADLSALQWSAFAGNFSSGLKNWALLGTCVLFITSGAGPRLWLSDQVGTWFSR